MTVKIGGLALRPDRPAVVVPLFRAASGEALEVLQRDGMDAAEIRLDMAGAQTPDAAAALLESFAGRGVPLIATARAAFEGGEWRGDENTRRDVLLRALDFADAVDIELASGEIAREVVSATKARGGAAIVSRHNFSAMDSRGQMDFALKEARALGADLFKIACATADESDAECILDFVRSHSGDFPLIATAMGEGAVARRTRLDLAREGSLIAFAAAEGASAPGQWTLAETVAALRG